MLNLSVFINNMSYDLSVCLSEKLIKNSVVWTCMEQQATTVRISVTVEMEVFVILSSFLGMLTFSQFQF